MMERCTIRMITASWISRTDDRQDRSIYEPATGFWQTAARTSGAVHASLSHDRGTWWQRSMLPSAEMMEATFGRLWMSPDTQVAIYDRTPGCTRAGCGGCFATWGTTLAAVLDGGWAKWLREGRAARAGEEGRPAAKFRGRPRKELHVIVDQMEAALHDPSVLLVDARAPERFEGKSEPLDRTPGHIPGAVNHFYRRNVTDEGLILPVETLRDEFSELLGDRPPSQVVMYCGSGVTACQNLLAMEHAGLSGAKLYPGSWSEWSSDQARPVETGPAGASVTMNPS